MVNVNISFPHFPGEYLEMLCDNPKLKFLVFCYHHAMMDGVSQTLWDKGVKYVRIDGTVKGVDRQAATHQFQNDPDTRVAVLSILAAGVVSWPMYLFQF